MKNLIRVKKKKPSKQLDKEKAQKRAEKQAEKDNHPLLSSSEFRSLAIPSFVVWGAAQLDPWVLGSDEAVKSAFERLADAIWHQGSQNVDDLVMETVSCSLNLCPIRNL